MPLAGGAIESISDQQGDLAVVEGNIVIVGATGNVCAVPSAGGTTTLLAQGQTNASSPFACGGAVCWLTGGSAPHLPEPTPFNRPTADRPCSIVVRWTKPAYFGGSYDSARTLAR